MTSTVAPVASNAKRLLWAGFTAILAAGVGFGIRGGIFVNWASEFNLTGAQLGTIGGAGFTSFCIGIMVGGVLVDKFGYGKLVLAAFLFHVLSAFVAFGAREGLGTGSAYQFLYWGTFLFGLANGTLEAVSNPLVATLFPHNRNHYLNILHASWPLGMVIGGLIVYFCGETLQWGWKSQLSLYLLPTALYGVMFLGQTFPKSEASAKGLRMGEMLKDVGMLGAALVSFMLYLFFNDQLANYLSNDVVVSVLSAGISVGIFCWIAALTGFVVGHWLLAFLFLIQIMIGAVELGTDGWIQNITGAILSPKEGNILFVFTSLLMFFLRFGAHFIETKIGLKPVGLLFVCALLACLGLNLVSAIHSFGPALGALLVYALGKTFFWPTMLAVASDRFPRTGAISISLMGGLGMMSAGLIGTPGLGYLRDRASAQELQQTDPALFEEWKSTGDKSKFFLFREVTAIDPQRLEEAKKAVSAQRAVEDGSTKEEDLALAAQLTQEQQTVVAADIQGNRYTLKVDSFIPAVMAVCFLLLIFYFKAVGGYRPLKVED